MHFRKLLLTLLSSRKIAKCDTENCNLIFIQKSHEETDKLREEITARDEKINGLIKEIAKLQQDVAVTHHTKDKSQERLQVAREESNVSLLVNFTRQYPSCYISI